VVPVGEGGKGRAGKLQWGTGELGVLPIWGGSERRGELHGDRAHGGINGGGGSVHARGGSVAAFYRQLRRGKGARRAGPHLGVAMGGGAVNHRCSAATEAPAGGAGNARRRGARARRQQRKPGRWRDGGEARRRGRSRRWRGAAGKGGRRRSSRGAGEQGRCQRRKKEERGPKDLTGICRNFRDCAVIRNFPLIQSSKEKVAKMKVVELFKTYNLVLGLKLRNLKYNVLFYHFVLKLNFS
jgi:hypothetical protein